MIKEFQGDNTSFKLDYYDAWQFELGECYLGKTNVVYLISPQHRKYFFNMQKILENITYEDDAIEVTFSAMIPHIFKSFKTLDNEYCVVFKKPKNVYPLTSILDYFDGEIDGKHIAWIIARLLNFTTFMQYNGLVHNGLTIENIFINPELHIVTIFGGWWYSTKSNEKMLGLNSELFNILPSKIIEDKLSTTYTDLNAIKLIGKKISGIEETGFSTIPDSMFDFLETKPKETALEEMKSWDEAKYKAYGKPVFIKLDIDQNKIYNKEDL